MSLSQTTDEMAILETREVSPTHFLVKIESFSLLGKHGIHKYETDEFDAGGYKWRLIIYPNEDKTGIDGDYLSVYLAISNTTSLPANWEVNAVFSFFLFNQNSCNYLYSLGKTRRFLAMKPEWGFSKFVSKKVLTDPSNGFLVGNNCVFGAEVFIVEKLTVSKCLSPKNVTVPYIYKRDWKISNFSQLGEVWHWEQFAACGFNWFVSLYPRVEDGPQKGRYLKVYLHLIDSKSVKAWFSICIKDQIGIRHIENTSTNWFSKNIKQIDPSSWGWTQFVELATLEDPTNGLIVKDCCLLEIKISVQSIV